jgi:hypothetical protein
MLIGKLLDKHEQEFHKDFFVGGEGGSGIVHFCPPHIWEMASATANTDNLMILCKVVLIENVHFN